MIVRRDQLHKAWGALGDPSAYQCNSKSAYQTEPYWDAEQQRMVYSELGVVEIWRFADNTEWAVTFAFQENGQDWVRIDRFLSENFV